LFGSLHILNDTPHRVAAVGRNFVYLNPYLSAYSLVKIQREGAPWLMYRAVNTCAVECYPLLCSARSTPYVLTPPYS